MLHSGQSAALSSNAESQLGHLAKKLASSSTYSVDDQKDLEEENYPSDSAEQDKVDEEQLVKELPSDVTASNEVQSEDEDQNEEEDEKESLEEESLDSLDEEAVVNSETFAKEFASAIDHVSEIAKAHRAEMIESVKEQIEDQTGQFVTDEMVSSAMRTFAVEDMDIADGSTSEEESDGDEADEDLLAKELAEALEAVRELAEEHRPEFVDRICSLYGEVNDEEPSPMELHSVFRSIRHSFAEEAALSMSSSIEESVDGIQSDIDSLSVEMELALAQVRKQAQLDQEHLVYFMMDCYRGLNGSDPSVEALSGILERIKEQLAEEEREEFLDFNQDGDDDEDSDYEEDVDAEQYAEDFAADIYIEGEHDGVEVDVFSLTESEVEVDGEYVLESDSASEYWADVQDEEDMDLWVSFDSASTWNSEEIESTEDEEELVDSALFAAEWCSAMEHIQNLAKLDQQRIVSSVMASCSGLGSASSSMVFDAMDSVKAAVLEYESEDSVEGEEEVAVEMASALHSVRELGAVHSEQIANRFADLYREENGEEASLSDLYAMFGHVQDCFAEEALSSDLHQETATEHPEQFAVEWAEAMDHVREIAKWHREELVLRLSAIYEEDMLRAPTPGALQEMLDVVQQHFADEAMHELLEDDLLISSAQDDQGRAQNEDSDYCPESDAADHDEYAFDDLDDALYRDSEFEADTESQSDTESDSDYLAQKDAVDLEQLYKDDAEQDLAASTDSEEVEEEKESVDADGGADDDDVEDGSEYSPDGDSFDYFGDYAEEHASTTDTEEDSDSTDASSDDAVDYNPDFDLFDYSADQELFRSDEDDDVSSSAFESGLSAFDVSLSGSEAESQSHDEDESESDDDDYVVADDSFDYSQDDIQESGGDEEDDEESGSAQESC